MNLKTGFAYAAYYIGDPKNAGEAQKLVYNMSGYAYILRKDGSMYNMYNMRTSFGIVYKGIISHGNPPICVAVKKLDRISGDTDKEFKTEVSVIGRTHHKNLVQLVGFCKQDDQRLLVYKYMSNGSLADYLFGDLRPSCIERVQIAQGIASGLLYLHEECSTQIIHCDIKPQNIYF